MPASTGSPTPAGATTGPLATYLNPSGAYHAAALPVTLELVNGCVIARFTDAEQRDIDTFVPVFPEPAHADQTGVDLESGHVAYGTPVILGGSGLIGDVDPTSFPGTYIPAACDPAIVRHLVGPVARPSLTATAG